MGYSTDFLGGIKIAPELKASQISYFKELFGGEIQYQYIGFEFDSTMSQIQWDGAEKFYGAEKAMELLISLVTEKYPEIKFNGTLNAQGEDYDDKWKLIVKDNIVSVKKIEPKGEKVTCPHCEEDFRLN